jgi:hypothetical protein
MISNGNDAAELDDEVVVDTERPFRMSPDAMRALTKATGSSLTDILQGDDDALRWQATAFGELHRRLARGGHLPDAETLWQRAGLAVIVISAPTAPDPLGAAFSTTSPPSVDSGE